MLKSNSEILFQARKQQVPTGSYKLGPDWTKAGRLEQPSCNMSVKADNGEGG